MKLRYKGTDGSMRLKTGQVYDVEIKTVRNYIVVFIKDSKLGNKACPYGSPGSLARYWKLP